MHVRLRSTVSSNQEVVMETNPAVSLLIVKSPNTAVSESPLVEM